MRTATIASITQPGDVLLGQVVVVIHGRLPDGLGDARSSAGRYLSLPRCKRLQGAISDQIGAQRANTTF